MFRKDVERHTAVKESICNHGQQLIKVKKLNTQPITEKLRLIDSQWSELQNELPHVQEELHHLQVSVKKFVPVLPILFGCVMAELVKCT